MCRLVRALPVLRSVVRSRLVGRKAAHHRRYAGSLNSRLNSRVCEIAWAAPADGRSVKKGESDEEGQPDQGQDAEADDNHDQRHLHRATSMAGGYCLTLNRSLNKHLPLQRDRTAPVLSDSLRGGHVGAQAGRAGAALSNAQVPPLPAQTAHRRQACRAASATAGCSITATGGGRSHTRVG